jgi:hypothetical protein
MAKLFLYAYPSDNGTSYNIRCTAATAALGGLTSGDASYKMYPRHWKPRRLMLVNGTSKKLVPTRIDSSWWNGLLPPDGVWTVVARIAEKMPPIVSL